MLNDLNIRNRYEYPAVSTVTIVSFLTSTGGAFSSMGFMTMPNLATESVIACVNLTCLSSCLYGYMYEGMNTSTSITKMCSRHPITSRCITSIAISVLPARVRT